MAKQYVQQSILHPLTEQVFGSRYREVVNEDEKTATIFYTNLKGDVIEQGKPGTTAMPPWPLFPY